MNLLFKAPKFLKVGFNFMPTRSEKIKWGVQIHRYTEFSCVPQKREGQMKKTDYLLLCNLIFTERYS